MSEELLDPESAAMTFINMLIARAYDGTVTDIKTILEKGVRVKGHYLNTLHTWYENQDQETQQKILEIATEAINTAVFGCLVILDGLSGGPPLKEDVSDFAVYLQIYNNEKAREDNVFQYNVRINPANTTEYLHDIFQRILQVRATGDK